MVPTSCTDGRLLVVVNRDACEHSRRQVESLKSTGISYIDCGAHPEEPICHQISAFPAFCGQQEGGSVVVDQCVVGLRTSQEDLDQVCKVVVSTTDEARPATGR